MAIFIASDFHCKYQKVAWLDTEDGEIRMADVDHVDVVKVREFFSQFPAGSVLGMETSGYSYWFEELVVSLGLELRIGHSQRIAASRPRRQKNDSLDAEHMLDLLVQGKFPTIWRPSPENRAQRALIAQRCRLVKIKTQLTNAVRALAYNYNVLVKRGHLSAAKKKQIAGVCMNPLFSEQRDEMLGLIDQLQKAVDSKEKQIEQLVEANEAARRLDTVPGVGPCTALATVLVLGPVERFANAKSVVCYVGLDCMEDSTDNAHKARRYGSISKQGNALLRWLLIQCATRATAARATNSPPCAWRRLYYRLLHRKDWRVAKTAAARKLLVCLYVLLRDGIDYPEFVRRGLASACPSRRVVCK